MRVANTHRMCLWLTLKQDLEVMFLRRDVSAECDIVVTLSQRFFKGNHNHKELA